MNVEIRVRFEIKRHVFEMILFDFLLFCDMSFYIKKHPYFFCTRVVYLCTISTVNPVRFDMKMYSLHTTAVHVPLYSCTIVHVLYVPFYSCTSTSGYTTSSATAFRIEWHVSKSRASTPKCSTILQGIKVLSYMYLSTAVLSYPGSA